MGTLLSADALDKLKCRFVNIIKGKLQEQYYGFDCTNVSQEEINKIKNYIFILESECPNIDLCEINSYISKLPEVYICISTPITVICNITITEIIVPTDCPMINIIRI